MRRSGLADRGRLREMDLVLRPWSEDDAPALTRAIAESLDHLRRWLPWAAEEPRDDAWRRAWIRDTLAHPTDRVFGGWLGDHVVGCCGLHARIAAGGLEIGYWVHADHLRRGIATEMTRRMCALAFGDPAVSVVEIHHEPANVASGAVPARLGFTEAGEDEQGHRVWRLTAAAR
jgi:RimJ/RimL family protein N-acetyltransferase